jgi:hypothetical protein
MLGPYVYRTKVLTQGTDVDTKMQPTLKNAHNAGLSVVAEVRSLDG